MRGVNYFTMKRRLLLALIVWGVAACGATAKSAAKRQSDQAAECLVDIFQTRRSERCVRQCNGGNGYACYYIADAYNKGTLDHGDDAQIQEFYQKACDNGNGPGCYHSALVLDVKGDPVSARLLYEKACNAPGVDEKSEERDAVARSCIEAGHTADKRDNDIEKASSYFKRACDLGYSGPLIPCPFKTGF